MLPHPWQLHQQQPQYHHLPCHNRKPELLNLVRFNRDNLGSSSSSNNNNNNNNRNINNQQPQSLRRNVPNL